MKPKIKPLLTVAFYFICSALFAQSVNINTAKKIAEHHLATISNPPLKSTGINGSTFHFTSVKVAMENNDTLYYVLNDTINKGFVIVSADKRAWPILGYSTTRSFDEKKQPEAFTAWMDNQKKEIEYIIKNNIQPNSATIASWENLSLKSATIETTSVEPLIQTKWGQECNYNSMCPTDAAGSCGHVATGCVATAMAQIMKFWNFPTKGKGSHSYSHPIYGTLSADFGSTTYQWSQMPDKVTNANNAVAELMYHCGVSLEMDYSPAGSSSWVPVNELIKFFNYSSNAVLVERSAFNTSAWIKMLKSELDLGHPIYYSGASSVIGHAFICDGYQGQEYFHFNWGWEGSNDGYFYIGNLNPAWYNFNQTQMAVINIVPGDLPDDYKGFFLNSNRLDADNRGDTLAVDVCSSAGWTAISDQSWLTLGASSGDAGKQALLLTAAENESRNNRSAVVTLKASGYSDQIITINQRMAIDVTPNGLFNSIVEDAVSIKKIILKGSIDARDFVTMRETMPHLTEVDLSEVNIVEYSGLDGPVYLNYRNYPANTIPESAFQKADCRANVLLEKIILPATTTSIGSSAFGNCKYLSTVDIAASINNIGIMAFEKCNALINVDANNPNYSSIDGVLFNKEQSELIVCPTSKKGIYSITSSVTHIDPFAFQYCDNLTSIIIPSSVISIGGYAFTGCNGLANITIPSSVLSIEGNAFFTCSALIDVDLNNPNYSSINGVLFNKNQSKIIHCPTSKTGNYTIPSNVSDIEAYAFSYCAGLTAIAIPTTVTSIGNNAFSNCTGLTDINIPSTINSIKYRTFSNCQALTTITIPLSVSFIESSAFENCKKLQSIYTYAVDPIDLLKSIDVFQFFNKNNCTLYVPFGSKAAYGVADQWKDFANIVEMPGLFLSKKRIGIGPGISTSSFDIASSSNWNATSDQDWLTISPLSGTSGRNTINFTSSALSTTSNRTAMVTISAPALDSQTVEITQYGIVELTAGNLKTVLAGQLSTITSLSLSGIIDARDFKTMRDDMPALTEIDLSGVSIAAYSGSEGTDIFNATYYDANAVPKCAFYDGAYGKNNLKLITLPNTITSIEYMAFNCCFGLSTIDIPSKTISIGNSAFSNCEGLTHVTLSSLILMSDRSFFMCNPSFEVDKNNQNYSSIDGVLFNKAQTELLKFPASKTGDYTIPSTVKDITSYSFYRSRLSNLSIPSSVNSIKDNTFNYTTLEKISIPSSVTSIGISAIAFNSELTTVSIPSTTKTIGDWAFGNCYKLNTFYAYPTCPVNLDSSPFVFSSINTDFCILYVPSGSKAAYSEANQWKDFIYIVEMENQQPLANAGINQIVKEGSLVVLDGTSSNDIEGKTLTYNWSSPNDIILNDSTVSMPTFTAPYVDTITSFTFSLVVNDGFLYSPADQVVVTVTPNNAPTAYAGNDQTVDENNQCTLDATASFDPDNDELTYLWSAPTGITLSSVTSAKPTFTAPEVSADTGYVFTLVVNDGNSDSHPDQVVVTVKNVNKAPIANAGADQTVNEKTEVTLDGSASYDPDENSLTYKWTAPAGITLSSVTSAKPTFTAPEVSTDTEYVLTLVVNDGTIDSPAAVVLITVKNINKVPIANAGIDQIVMEGESVTLDGSATSDPDENSLTYKWTAPAGITLSSTTSAKPTFTAPEVSSDTEYIFTLVVNDGTIVSPADEVVITVKNINKIPIADAGFDQIVMEGETVTLDGSASYDPDGATVSYLWSTPTGITLSISDIANPTFIAPDVAEQTRFSFSLVVNDNQYASQPDTVIITVEKKTWIDNNELISSKQIHIYPNPTSGLLIISMENYFGQAQLIEVFNSIGQLVLKTEPKVDAKSVEIDLSAFTNGIYLIKVNTKTQSYQQKIIKE